MIDDKRLELDWLPTEEGAPSSSTSIKDLIDEARARRLAAEHLAAEPGKDRPAVVLLHCSEPLATPRDHLARTHQDIAAAQ